MRKLNKTRKGGGGLFSSFKAIFNSAEVKAKKKADVYNTMKTITEADLSDDASLDKLYNSGLLKREKIDTLKQQQPVQQVVQQTNQPVINQQQPPSQPTIGGTRRRKLKHKKSRN